MKFIVETFKNIFSIILVCISVAFLLGYTMLDVTEELLSEENIVNTIKNIDIVELIGEEKKQEIYATLEKAGIPTEYVDAMLEDEELKEYLGGYIVSSMEYLGSNEGMPEIDAEEVTNLLTSTFDRVIKEAENHNIDVDTYITEEQQVKIHEKIEEYVPEVVEKIPEAQELIENEIKNNSNLLEAQNKIEEFNNVINTIRTIYQYKFFLLIGTIVPLILIVIMKFKKLRFIKWLSLPWLISAGILKLICVVIPMIISEFLNGELKDIEQFINPSIETILSNMNSLVLVYLIIGIVLMIIQIGIKVYQNTLKDNEYEKDNSDNL